MTTRTAAAWDLIRDADPIPSSDVAGASETPAAQQLLHRITADVSTSPAADADVLTLRDVGPSRVLAPRRRGLVAGLAAAVVVLLAGVTVVAVRRENPNAAPTGPQSTAAAPTTAPSTRGQTTAAGYSRALLAELPLPAGARRLDRPPIPELKQSALKGNGILYAQVAWWTVPGSFAAAVARMGNAGARPSRWTSRVESTGFAGTRSHGWTIEVRDPDSRFVSSVNVTVAAHGTTVGLAAQVDTYAKPIRTPQQVIPASIDAATFTVTAFGPSNASRHLNINGPRIIALVRKINAIPTYVVLFQVPCPAPAGSITVTFRRGSQRWVLDVTAGSSLCNVPTLTGADHKTGDLTPSTALITDVLAAAGLPSNYFTR